MTFCCAWCLAEPMPPSRIIVDNANVIWPGGKATRGISFSSLQHREPQCGRSQKHAHRDVKNSQT